MLRNLSSSLSIIDNIERTIRENNMSLEEDFPNLKIITYTKLMKYPYIDADKKKAAWREQSAQPIPY